MTKELTPEELDERIAILHRFRNLLEAQRTKFREYLHVLEKQQVKIEDDDGEALLAHTELETQIVANISALQKVIEPMQALYEKKGAATAAQSETNAIAKMQAELADLRSLVLAQNERNQTLLIAHMNRLHKQVADLRLKNPYRGRHSVYAEKTTTGSVFAIEA